MASASNGANLGIERELWQTADALCYTLLPKLISCEVWVRSGLLATQSTPVHHVAADTDHVEDQP
jgi:hypothetical protein